MGTGGRAAGRDRAGLIHESRLRSEARRALDRREGLRRLLLLRLLLLWLRLEREGVALLGCVSRRLLANDLRPQRQAAALLFSRTLRLQLFPLGIAVGANAGPRIHRRRGRV